MTISSTARKAGPYVGNSVATSFAFAFKVFAATDLQVVKLTAATGVQSTLVLNTDYSVALNADQNASPGGTVTYPLSGSLLASPDTITIAGNIDALQGVSLLTAGGFYPSVIENAFDRCVILIQQLFDKASRSLRGPVSDPSTVNMEMPPASVRASKALGFDGTGQPIAISPATAVTDASGITFDTGVLPDFFRTKNNRVVDSITALKALDKTKYTRAFVTGYYTAGDGGGGSYWYDSTDTTSSDNGGTIIVAADGARWKLQQIGAISARQFGAKGDGVSDDAAALNAALAVVTRLYFPAGKYRFNSAITYTFPNPASGGQATSYINTLTLYGDGADNTILYWPSTAGFNVAFRSQQHSLHVRDLSFTTGAQGAGNAVTLTNNYPYFGTFVAQSEFNNVTFRGDDGYAFSGGAGGKYWSRCVQVANVSDINFYNCNFYGNSNGNVGTGVYLDSPGAGTFVAATGGTASLFTVGTVYNFIGCNFSFLAQGVYYGNNVQTVTLNNCFFGNGQNAVVCPSGIYNNSNQGLIVTGCSAFCTADIISVLSPINNIQISNNFFAVNAAARGVFISPGVNLSVLGNQFIPYAGANTAAAGIELQALASGSVQTVDILTPGTGYLQGASATVSGGGGANLAVTIASVNGAGAITGLNITNRGSGYSGTITLTFPGGSGATFRVNIASAVLQIIDGNTFSSVTNGIILDNQTSGVKVGMMNSYTAGMTNNVLDTGTNNVVSLVYDSSGLRTNKPSSALGYATGSGGSVVQATNKTTAVTLNTVSGQITTNNAALAANTEVAFTVNNSVVSNTDIVIPQVGNANYKVRITDAAAGSFVVRLLNNTGGSLSDAVAINFAILKAAVA